MTFLDRFARRPSQVPQPSPGPGHDDSKARPLKRSGSIFGRRTLSISTSSQRLTPPSATTPDSSRSSLGAGSPTHRRVTERSASVLLARSASDLLPSGLPDCAWLDAQAQAQGVVPKKDMVVGGKVLWKHGTTYEYVRSALGAYHECAPGDLNGRHKAVEVLSSAVGKYLGKKDGRHTASVLALSQALERERQVLAGHIRDAIHAGDLRSPSVADILRASAAIPDETQPDEADLRDPPSPDTKAPAARRSPSTSFSTPSLSTSASSDLMGGAGGPSPLAAESQFSLYARTASATKLSRTVPTSGLFHAALLATEATRRDGEIVRPDVVVGGVVIKKNSTRMKCLLDSLDHYHDLQPYQLHARQAALKEVEKNVEAYLAKREGRYKDAAAFLNFRAKLEQEAHTVTALIAINVEAEWQRDNGNLPAPASPTPQLNAQDAADLIRAGVPSGTIARGMAMHLSREQIAQELAPCARARVPYKAVTQDGALSRFAIVPGSLRKLGSGAVATTWRVDIRQGEQTLAMVFKPEPPPKTDIGFMAKASGIPPREANLSGRSAAASLCSQHLKLDLVPTTVVAILEIDGSPEAGSLMGFVDGFQLLAERSAHRPLTADQAKLMAARPRVLQDYALECGCTSARLDGSVLRLERRIRVEVTHDSEGNPLARSELRDVPALIRMALPQADGRLRRLLADAQLFIRFIRGGDCGPMNIIFTVDDDGRLSPRFIDNDVSFGPDWTIRSEPGTTFDERRLQLPPYVSRSLKDAFDQLSTADLGDGLEAMLGSAPAALSVIRDVSYVRTLLASYDQDGRILDTDADWESPAVTKALGVDLAGSEFTAAVALQDDTGSPSFKLADARIAALKAQARTCSYLSRESMEERLLELDWTAVRLQAKGKNEPFANYVQLPALFDLDELMRRLRAAGADTKSGASSSTG